MPKVTNTRKQRAEKLFERLQHGPNLSMIGREHGYTPEEVRAHYRMWVQSWVLEDVKALIPELRGRTNTP